MQIFIVDAFASKAFTGNPAAVCLLAEAMEVSWMQSVAAEMNLSETAFLVKREQDYLLRWFTPTDEVDLCGHATLASAHIIWELGHAKPEEELHFQTKSGRLSAKKAGEQLQLNFPLELEVKCDAPMFLLESLGVTPLYIGKNRMDYIIEVASEEIVRGLKPDFNLLQQVKSRGVIVTSKSDSEKYDFVSRCFYPATGVNEDPVTGSAHCCLGPYWQAKLKKSEMTASQVSQRGGDLELKIEGHRILISGQAITTLRGTLVAHQFPNNYEI
jgi:PhzF family phenazine biosynthesis protein